MDLTTRYMGLRLKNPLIASASPLNADLDNIRRLEEAGAAAIVLPSMFEEQIRDDDQAFEDLISAGAESVPEASGYFPRASAYNGGPYAYLDLVECATRAVGIPVIGSLNGASSEGWTNYARLIEQAGASALELNVYLIPADLATTGREVEQRHLDILAAVKRAVSVPVAIKLSPFFSAFGHMATELDRAGADALVLFNRVYHPDIDLVHLRLNHELKLSSPADMQLPLAWLAMLAGRLRASLAASSGVETADDALKYLLSGADVVMTTSALLRRGPGHVRTLLDQLVAWLEARGLGSVAEIRGTMARRGAADPEAQARAEYIDALQSYRGAHIRRI